MSSIDVYTLGYILINVESSIFLSSLAINILVKYEKYQSYLQFSVFSEKKNFCGSISIWLSF